MSRGPDAGTAFRRAIECDAKAAGCAITVSEAAATRWASATFVGAQHRLRFVAADDAALERWLGGLADADLPTRGHLVADVAVLSVMCAGGEATVVLEGLTVES